MGVVPAHPHRVGELDVDGELVPPRNALRAAVPFDLTGSPAISIPFGWSSEGLPIGVQIVGRHFDERSILRAAAALETSKGDAMRPPL
jgi:aspartyl-tRNA(Asn)/glutamyl-tRNA(Gln) amidotransferase subunit A